MTGLEIIKAPGATAGEIADIIAEHCPPTIPQNCDRLSCRECWLAWLTTGEPPKRKGPPDEQAAPGEEGLHSNLIEHLRKQRRVEKEMQRILGQFTRPHG